MTVSANYIKIKPENVRSVAETLDAAWQSSGLPDTQYESVVKGELEALKRGDMVAPYAVLKRLLDKVPEMNHPETRLLDVGAASGYYSQVLESFDFQCKYQALDYSTYFRDLAEKLFPGIQFEVGSADAIPFPARSFDVVLHGACIMHLPLTYEKAIKDAARVTKYFVIFHRTPVHTDDTPTEFFHKSAYGVPCVETHFNEKELLGLFTKYGLSVQHEDYVFRDGHFAHKSYLLKV